MAMLDAGVAANPVSRVEPQRGGGQGVLPNIAVSTDYIEDLIYNKIPQITSSPQDPGRFGRRKLEPASENVAAQPPALPPQITNVRLQRQQPNIDEVEQTEVVRPPIAIAPKYAHAPLELLRVLAPHLADPELELRTADACNEQAALNGVTTNARG